MNAHLTDELNRTRLNDLHRRAAQMRQARDVAVRNSCRRLTFKALFRRRRGSARPASAAPDAA